MFVRVVDDVVKPLFADVGGVLSTFSQNIAPFGQPVPFVCDVITFVGGPVAGRGAVISGWHTRTFPVHVAARGQLSPPSRTGFNHCR